MKIWSKSWFTAVAKDGATAKQYYDVQEIGEYCLLEHDPQEARECIRAHKSDKK